MALVSHDDLIYLILLLLGIVFGRFYRKIVDIESKKWIGTAFGLAIVLFTSGLQSLHLLLILSVSYTLLYSAGRKCHIFIFGFLMTYLIFFRCVTNFGLPQPSGHLNMIIMVMVLKIIGLAFERDTVLTKLRDFDKHEAHKSHHGDKECLLTKVEIEIKSISFVNMFHYCFNYIGLLTGPYYSYKTFFDYFNLPFALNSEKSANDATLRKLKQLPVTALLFAIATYIWPLSYATSAEFYEQRSWLYRLFYIWPTFFIFRMRIYSGMILAECVCTYAGFGGYPKDLHVKCGHGALNEITDEHLKNPEKFEYDFETIETVDTLAVEKCMTFREGMKHWNKCVQYWLAMNVYKRFPSKKYRIIATMAVSAYWHGVHPGYYFCILGPVFYLPVEDLYMKLIEYHKLSGTRRQVTYLINWTLKFFAFSYMGTAFLLKDVEKIWKFYGSVYHSAYIFWAVMYGICFVLWQKKKHAWKKAEKMRRHEEHEEAKKLE